MEITTRELKFQDLRRRFEAGQMDQAAFEASVDKLGFQDGWGRYWSLGSETGVWYYYDGQGWQPADPRQAERLPFVDEQGRSWQRGEDDQSWFYYQPETGRWLNSDRESAPPAFPPPEPSNQIQTPVLTKQAGLIIGIVGALILAWLILLPVSSASPPDGPRPAPSPRPPLSDGGSSGGGFGDQQSDSDDDDDSPGPTGAIFGQVIDLSTNQPAAGLEVEVSGQIVRTDSDGSYSITGLPAGEYVVSPVLNGRGRPVQGAVYASVDGIHAVTADLSYYSDLSDVSGTPSLTATPQLVAAAGAGNTETGPALVPSGPEASVQSGPAGLPPSGADIRYRPFLFGAVGLLLMVLGGIILIETRPGSPSPVPQTFDRNGRSTLR